MRVFFRKTGRVKYISHLDLQQTMQRALKRANLPVWETEGFNPHVYITFALPLSLGIESVCESFDIKMIEEISPDEICGRLNNALNEDLKIYKAAEPVYKHTEIQKAMYEIITNEPEKFLEFLNQNEIIITKKTKKGEKQIDLKPLIEIKNIKENKTMILLPAGTALNINPIQLISAYGASLSDVKITRVNVFCTDGKEFI
jgi:radical SAM-linked protein